MPFSVNIANARNGKQAKVSRYGQLVVAPIDYSSSTEAEIELINTPYNLIEPESGKSIVITDILISGDKTVSNTTPADVLLFQSDGINSATVIERVVRPQILRGGNLAFTGLNLLVPQGRWLNVISDDVKVIITVMFYKVSNGG